MVELHVLGGISSAGGLPAHQQRCVSDGQGGSKSSRPDGEGMPVAGQVLANPATIGRNSRSPGGRGSRVEDCVVTG
jgi:hypothetical protein